MKGRRNLRSAAAALLALLLCGCTAPVRRPILIDAGAWPTNLVEIALVELSFDRRYRPPPQSYLVDELRLALRQELARKGYRLLLADRGETIYRGETGAAELIARAPAEADAVLALHIDFLFMSGTLSERNPPPEVEIAGEARLIASPSGRELWRDRGNGLAGGTAGLPVIRYDAMRQEALADLVRNLLATLPPKP